MRPRPWADRDRGAVIIEAALVFPVLMFLIFGMLDFGTATLKQSQVSSAARDGARVGILNPRGADANASPHSASWNAIDAAVRKRLAGTKIDSVTVICRRPNGTSVSCASASVDADLLEVSVKWTYRPVTFVGALIGTKQFTSTARMAIVGASVTTTTSTSTTSTSSTSTSTSSTSTSSTSSTSTSSTTTTSQPINCRVTSVSISPSPVTISYQANRTEGTLTQDLTFTVQTSNWISSCGLLLLAYEYGNSPAIQIGFTTNNNPTYLFVVKKSYAAKLWTEGTKDFIVIGGSSNPALVYQGTFQVVEG